MNVPAVIPIRHEPDHRTSTVGRCRGGQFFASVTAAPTPEKRWCAVLHRFDEAGAHLGSRIEFTGAAVGGERTAVAEARRLLDEWLAALPERQYQDIAIAPFEVRFEGVLFGLVLEQDEEDEDEEDEDDDEDGVWLEFHPDGLGFHAPWDGCYDT
jgi:hypothetical protein